MNEKTKWAIAGAAVGVTVAIVIGLSLPANNFWSLLRGGGIGVVGLIGTLIGLAIGRRRG